MKFRKKPIVIEAERVHRFTSLGETIMLPLPITKRFFHAGWWVKTLEGWYRVQEGDWIITGIKGEHYPCKPDIFNMTYEEVK